MRFVWFKEGSRGTWIITSAIRVVRVFDEKERQEILKKNGYDEIAAYARYKVAFEKKNCSLNIQNILDNTKLI